MALNYNYLCAFLPSPQGILFYLPFEFINLLTSVLIISSYISARGIPPVQGLSLDLYRVLRRKAKSQVLVIQVSPILRGKNKSF